MSGTAAVNTMSLFAPLPDGLRAGLEKVQPGNADPVAAIVGLMLVAKRLNFREMRIGCGGRRRGRGRWCRFRRLVAGDSGQRADEEDEEHMNGAVEPSGHKGSS